jgi:hypothetical protein
MKSIQEVITLLNKDKDQATNSREIKMYTKFIGILRAVERQQLSTQEISQIEIELDFLDLTIPSKNKKKHIKKALNRFMDYLKNNYSLITEGHYTSLGIALGMCFGLAFGTIFNQDGTGNAMGMCFGMFIGLLIGKHMDNEAEKNNNVLFVK